MRFEFGFLPPNLMLTQIECRALKTDGRNDTMDAMPYTYWQQSMAAMTTALLTAIDGRTPNFNFVSYVRHWHNGTEPKGRQKNDWLLKKLLWITTLTLYAVSSQLDAMLWVRGDIAACFALHGAKTSSPKHRNHAPLSWNQLQQGGRSLGTWRGTLLPLPCELRCPFDLSIDGWQMPCFPIKICPRTLLQFHTPSVSFY